jgi:MFS family permease
MLWTGYGISALGSQLTMLALPLLILDVTGSATFAGLAGTLRILAFIGAQLLGGALADRVDRRAMLAVADAGRFLALAAVAWLAVGGRSAAFAAVLLVVGVEGVLSAAANAAAMAALPRLVEPAETADALALGQAQSYAIRLVGPLLGGVLYQVHPALPFALDALTYAVALGFVLALRTRLGGGDARSGARSSLAGDIGQGIRYVLRSRYLVLLMLWAALANFATAGIGFALVLAFAGRGRDLGVATSVVALCGLVGALAARRGPAGGDPTARIRAATAVMALVAAGTALAPGPVALAGCMAAIAALSPLVSVPLNARVYALVPDELMGRVQASLFLVGGSLYPLATLVAGGLAEAASLAAAVGAFALVLGVVLALVLLPGFRPAPRGARDPAAPVGAGAGAA